MTLRKLEKRKDGGFACPTCGKPLRFKDGDAVAVVGGQLDMDNYKPRYICDDCKVFFREVLTTNYYDVFPLEEAAPPKAVNIGPRKAKDEPRKTGLLLLVKSRYTTEPTPAPTKAVSEIGVSRTRSGPNSSSIPLDTPKAPQ